MSKKSIPPQNWREGRRMRAWELHEQGWKQKDIAAALGVSEGAVSQWLKKAKAQGVQALRHQPPPGAQPKLSPEQQAQLPVLLAQGAASFGFRGEVWTTARVAEMIKQQFGVSYHRAYCSRLLRRISRADKSPSKKRPNAMKPPSRPRIRRTLACTKKKSEEEKRTIVFVDQSAFYLLPMAVRTYAPVGKTPVLKVKLTRDHLAAMDAITPRGRIFMQTQDHSYTGPDVVRFLQLLTREIPGQLLVIWDGAPIHRCQVVKDFLAQGGAKRIHLERLPAYAPELNPQEGVWNLLKRVELRHVCCLDVQHVQREVRRAKERLRHRHPVLRQCFAHAGCSL